MATLSTYDIHLLALEHTLQQAKISLSLTCQHVDALLETTEPPLSDRHRRALDSLRQMARHVAEKLAQEEAAVAAAYAPSALEASLPQDPVKDASWASFVFDRVRALRSLQQTLTGFAEGRLQSLAAATLIVDAFLPVPQHFSLTTWVLLEQAEKEVARVLDAAPCEQAVLSTRLREHAASLTSVLQRCLLELANRIDETQYAA